MSEKIDETPDVVLGPLFERAWRYAATLHAQDTRKGVGIPYTSHLLGVASLVLEAGGDEEQAAAALLHDAVEDHPEATSVEEIASLFGPRVARIVEGCTDAFEHPKPPWCERKTRYIRHLAEAHPDVLLVSLADKTHNARALAADASLRGRATLERFRGGPGGTLWYYRAIVDAFRARGRDVDARSVEQVDAAVTALETAVGARAGDHPEPPCLDPCLLGRAAQKPGSPSPSA